jgi:hypothetical protein
MTEWAGYDFTGLDIHNAITVSEQIRAKIRSIPLDSPVHKAQWNVLTEINGALTEYIYIQSLIQERERFKDQPPTKLF